MLNLRGEKLELSLIDIAEKEVSLWCFIQIYLPFFFFFKLMFDCQSQVMRRLAVRAAERYS